jgi:transposase
MKSSTVVSPQVVCWIGLDVAAETFDACIAPPVCERPITLSVIRQWNVTGLARTREGAAKLLVLCEQASPGQALHVVMEATGSYSRQLALWLLELAPQLRLSIVNPRRIRDFGRSLGQRNKNDKIDARLVACYGLERQPKPWQPDSPQRAALRDLSRLRERLQEQHTANQNMLSELGRSCLPAKAKAAAIEALQIVQESLGEQVEKLQKAIASAVDSDPILQAHVAAADSVPGVGKIVAWGLIGEIGDFSRFQSRRQLETFAGVSVKVRQSGKRLNRAAGLTREGSRHIRRLLYLAAMAAVRGKNALSRHYKQLIARGKIRKVALGSVMRMILRLVRHVIIHDQAYDDQLAGPKPRLKQCAGGQ